MNKDLLNRWIRPEIRSQSAYHVPDSTGMIKLDAMENPYTWPHEIVDKWVQRLKLAEINRYPDPHAVTLRHQLVDTLKIPASQHVMLGNGSDELIQIITLAVSAPGRVVLAPEPGFVMYRLTTVAVGMDYCGVSLKLPDFSLDMSAMRSAIMETQPAVIFLAYPNNPTGNLWRREDIEEIIAMAPGLVVLDEAYAPFASDSFLGDLGRFDNLLVMRTLSKMGMAALRLGLLVGSSDWLNEFDKLRLPYNINELTQISAEFALQHADIFAEQAMAIRHDRELVLTGLNQIAGIKAYSSQANFILFQTPAASAAQIFDGLKERGILVKNFPMHAVLSDYLRVTVGTPEENASFLEKLQQVV